MTYYTRFFEEMQQDFKAFAYWCGVFMLFRIAFIAIYSGQLNGDYNDVPMALLLGLRLSLKTAGILMLVGVVFATLPRVILKNGLQQKFAFHGICWRCYFSASVLWHVFRTIRFSMQPLI